MADTIKNIKLGDVTYPIEDVTARATASEAKSAADSAENTANSALTAVSSKVGAKYESDTNTLVLE
jgi:hypothetical protein|nr:MAG TPA: hypothetical protein [Caudoviricetes sp.]